MPSPLPEYIPSSLAPSARARLMCAFNTSYLITYYKKFFSIDVRRDFLDVPRMGIYECEATGLRQFYPVVTGQASLYRHLESFDWYYLEEKEEYTVAQTFVQAGMHVLEVGCGRGAFARKIPSAQYCGLEYNEQAIAQCRDRGLHVLPTDLTQWQEVQALASQFYPMVVEQVSRQDPLPRGHDVLCVFEKIAEHPCPSSCNPA